MDVRTRAQILGENLQRIRKEKGYSRKQLAQGTGLRVDLIGLYETGKTLAPLDKIFALADFLKVSVTNLIGENNFSYEIPNIEKIVEDKIFDYRYKRALQLVHDSRCFTEDYKGSIIIRILANFTRVDDDKSILVTSGMRTSKIKDKKSFVTIVETAEARSIRQEISFTQALKDFLDECGILDEREI